MSRDPLDVNRLIGKIAGVLMEPYTNFIAKLYADGRITDVEVEELKRSFEQRVPQLAELVEERLKEEKEDSESIEPSPSPRAFGISALRALEHEDRRSEVGNRTTLRALGGFHWT